MAPYTNIPLSPAELSYLQTSLSATPPIRPDGRSPTQFRPLVAEADILPSANGSARVCFSDGTEAIVGVKAEVEKSRPARQAEGEATGEDVEMGEDINATGEGRGRNEWLEVAIDVPGLRDDDALPVFLGAMLSEALGADGGLRDRLWINARFHWRLYVDVSFSLLLSTYALVLFPLEGKPFKGMMLTISTTDPAPVAASFIPASSAELDDTSRSAQHPPPSSALARRRRPTLQRRLGSFEILVPTPIEISASSTPSQTAHHAPRNNSRSQHPLRSLPRRARRRRNSARHLRCANVSCDSGV